MANPIKVLKGVKKVTSKAMRGKANSKGLKETNVKGIERLTTGRAKAITRNVRVKEFGVNITKGKNKDWAKNANKTTLPSATKSRRASVKEANFNSRMQKHPLVRNTGQSSAEGKYRYARKSIPVKKRGK